jgi:hypothetical protein
LFGIDAKWRGRCEERPKGGGALKAHDGVGVLTVESERRR